ncbi:unnamed protein product [Mucor hiemalis]
MGKRSAEKKERDTIAPEAAGVKKAGTAHKKGKNVQAGADEIDDIFNKKNISNASEIDDIFNTKTIKDDDVKNKTKEPVLSKSARRKAAKKSKKVTKEVTEEKNDEDMEEGAEEEEEEELSEEQVKKVEEIVFAELAAVKNSKIPAMKAAPPPDADDGFWDSKGIKKTSKLPCILCKPGIHTDFMCRSYN